MLSKESDPARMAEDDISWDELLRWVEFGCWTAVALFPMLYWVNGPAVSTDQYVMRSILIVVAVVGAVGLRFRHLLKNKVTPRDHVRSQEGATQRFKRGTMTLCNRRSADDDTTTMDTTTMDTTTMITPLSDDAPAVAGPPRWAQSLCQFTFVFLGTLLVCAAGFKAYQGYREPMLERELVATVAMFCFEICFGLWLLAGIRTSWTWLVAILCFLTFGVVSTHKVWNGEVSCGCFGVLRVNPKVSLGIDVAAVVLLMLCRQGLELPTSAALRRVFPRMALLGLSLSLVGTVLMIFGQSRFTRMDDLPTASGAVVILEPETWTGQSWPLLARTGLERELATGEWDVLMFRHDCHLCHEVMKELERTIHAQEPKPKIALIGIGREKSDPQVDRLKRLACLLSYLPQDQEWFASTPLRVNLKDGVCVSAQVVEQWDET